MKNPLGSWIPLEAEEEEQFEDVPVEPIPGEVRRHPTIENPCLDAAVQDPGEEPAAEAQAATAHARITLWVSCSRGDSGHDGRWQ